MHQENGIAVNPSSRVGGMTKVRNKRATGKRYDICLIEEYSTHEELQHSRTVIGTAFEQPDGRVKAVLKPGISVGGTLEIVPILGDS